MSKINICYVIDFPLNYYGGINYFKNSIFALDKFNRNNVNITLLVSNKISQDNYDFFSSKCNIIKSSVLNRFSILWFIEKSFEIIFRFSLIKSILIYKGKINLIFLSNNFYKLVFKKYKIINWIPDFQFMHLTNLYSKKQLEKELINVDRSLRKSNSILLSSNDARKDLKAFFPEFLKKSYVVNFVSQTNIFNINDSFNLKKYTNQNFFYLPNQFWAHKNHLVVFKSIKILKEKNINVKLLVSGNMSDFRGKSEYLNNLKYYIKKHNLNKCIKLLGEIPYNDVLQLIKNSVAVINPSFFEGWSSTVEESKSINKLIILSNINVHLEQNPKHAIYFNPKNEIELASVMEKVFLNPPKFVFEQKKNIYNLNLRTKEFSNNLLNFFKNQL